MVVTASQATHRFCGFIESLGQIVTVRVRNTCRCGNCVEATNAKPEKEKGPEFW